MEIISAMKCHHFTKKNTVKCYENEQKIPILQNDINNGDLFWPIILSPGNGNSTGLQPVESTNPPFVVGITPGGISTILPLLVQFS